MNKLIAFDFSGTLEIVDKPAYPDMAEALGEAIADNPGLHFGIATNGSLLRVTNFLFKNEVEPMFKNSSGELLAAGSYTEVTFEDVVEFAVPKNWMEKLSGRYTDKDIRVETRTDFLREKPSGDLLGYLIRKAGVEDASSAVFIGDESVDQGEAYSAKVSFIRVDGFQTNRGSMRPLLQTAVEEVTHSY